MSYRNIEGVLHVNPDLFVDENFRPGHRKRYRSNMGVCLRCTLTLAVITLVLIGGTFLYLHFRESHLRCYSPYNGRVCYSDVADKDRYKNFGTKTDYNVSIQAYIKEAEKPLDFPGCEPILFYLFQRHSTRYPDRKKIVEADEVLKRLKQDIETNEKTRLCKQDLDKFPHYTFPFIPDHDNFIAPQGRLLVAEQVARLKKRFPTIFSVDRRFDTESTVVDFTGRIRSRETAYAFMEQWFTKEVFDSRIKSQISDHINTRVLEFHSICKDKLKRNGTYYDLHPEVAKLEGSSYYSTLLETLSSRLGRKISKKEMLVMYKQCAFELTINGDSPWCAAFTTEDLKLLEFREDLDDYLKDSYGEDRLWKSACAVSNDLFSYITKVTAPSYLSNNSQMVLHFSHAGAMKRILAYFQIGSGPAFSWDAACDHRDWHSSKFCPFNSNLLFLLYKCPDKQLKIAALLNEELVKLNGCSSELCPLEEFQKVYRREEINCDPDSVCI